MNLAQILRFGAASSFSNGLGFSLAIGTFALTNQPLVSSTISYLTAGFAAFVLQSKFTFTSSSRSTYKSAYRFLASHAIVFTLNLFVIHVLCVLLFQPFWLSSLLSMLLCGVGMFILQKEWVFRDVNGNNWWAAK